MSRSLVGQFLVRSHRFSVSAVSILVLSSLLVSQLTSHAVLLSFDISEVTVFTFSHGGSSEQI